MMLPDVGTMDPAIQIHDNIEGGIKDMLGVILDSNREFEEHDDAHTKPGNDEKTRIKSIAINIVRTAVQNKPGRFTKKELLSTCPSLSKSSVETALMELIRRGEVRRFGTGRSTFYVRSDALL